MGERINQAPRDESRVPTIAQLRAGMPRSWFAVQQAASDNPMTTGTYIGEVRNSVIRGEITAEDAVGRIESYDGTMAGAMAINAVAGWIDRRSNRYQVLQSAAVLSGVVDTVPVEPLPSAADTIAGAVDRITADLEQGANVIMHPVPGSDMQRFDEYAGVAAG